MAVISSPGLGSGLDINGIVTKLMQVESQPLTALATKEAGQQAKLSAYGSLKGALSFLQTAARTLMTGSTFTGKSAVSSESLAVTATALNTAAAGTYNI
jgi:flagellar hook-associated protein 2